MMTGSLLISLLLIAAPVRKRLRPARAVLRRTIRNHLADGQSDVALRQSVGSPCPTRPPGRRTALKSAPDVPNLAARAGPLWQPHWL
jgi:hypothetical protein